MPKISVIMPVYNEERFLRQCLDSVMAQTEKDIEIICVDDESTDGSLAILRKYEQKDPRIKVLTQKNAGAGAARNNGLAAATGKYLSFLDSDDFFEPDMLENAMAACERENADFCVFKADLFDVQTGASSPCFWAFREDMIPAKKVFSYKDIKRDIFRVFNGWAWDKLYNADFVRRNGLLFQEQRTTNDMFFVFSALVKAERITTINRVYAHQRVNISSSLSRTREKSWKCFYAALIALRDEIRKMGIYDEIKDSYVNYALHFSLWNINTITGSGFEKLYNALRDECFAELGVTGEGRDFFYNADEYAQYERIMNSSMAEYLSEDVARLKQELAFAKRQIGTSEDKKFDGRSYKIGRTITFVPRKICNFFRYCRSNGFKYAMSMIKLKFVKHGYNK